VKVFGWIIFIISLICSFMIINDLILGVKYVGWSLLILLISFSLSIGGFIYFFRNFLFKENNFLKLILIVLVLLFAVYVWPTPYRYMPNYHSHIPFRINRITGVGELWWGSRGWEKMK